MSCCIEDVEVLASQVDTLRRIGVDVLASWVDTPCCIEVEVLASRVDTRGVVPVTDCRLRTRAVDEPGLER
jgi:hypothetical protein